MISKLTNSRARLVSSLTVLVMLLTGVPSVFAGNQLEGRWTLTITIPESPTSSETRSFSVELEVSPRGESLHGRANLTDQVGRKVGAAWRQVGKNVSIAYELPCPGDGPCASLILMGRVKGGGVLIKRGTVIVVWDTPNSKDPSLYDTSNGSFRGTRVE